MPMPRSKKNPKGGRLHLRVAADLVERMHDYAARHHTDLTALVTQHFLGLLRAEEIHTVPEVEQV